MIRKTIFLIIILIFSCTYSQEKVTISRNGEYNALKLTTTDFKSLVADILEYCTKMNKSDTFSYDLDCYFRKKDGEISIYKIDQIKDLELPEKFNDLYFKLQSSQYDIRSVELDFNNFSREIKIVGNDEILVKGLFSQLDQKLSEKEKFYGSEVWQIIFFMFIFVVFIIAIISLIYSINQLYLKKINGWQFLILLFSLTYIIMGLYFIFSDLELLELLPAFQITDKYENWIDNYANIFGLIGFIYLVLEIIIRIGKIKFNRK